MLSNLWIDRSFERLGSFRIAWALISLCRTSKHFVRKRGRGRRRGRGRGRKRERKKWWHLKETPKWRLGGQRQPMAVVFRNGFFFFSLSLLWCIPSFPPFSLSLCLTLPRETRSVRRLAAGLKGSRYSVAESTRCASSTHKRSACSFLPRPPRSFPALVLSSFSPYAFYVPRKSGERTSISLSSSSPSLFFLPSLLPSLPLAFSERVARLTYNKHTHLGGSLVGCQPQKRNKTALRAANVESRSAEKERKREKEKREVDY